MEVKLLDSDYNVVDGNASDLVIVNGTTLNVGNTPGAALPNTGGLGTRLIYILGIMLTALASIGLVMRKRRIIA